MPPQLPPPDPAERLDFAPTGGGRVLAPVAIFPGPVDEEANRIADGILDLRPGLLFVVAPGR